VVEELVARRSFVGTELCTYILIIRVLLLGSECLIVAPRAEGWVNCAGMARYGELFILELSGIAALSLARNILEHRPG
jgi:hypothetical protein